MLARWINALRWLLGEGGTRPLFRLQLWTPWSVHEKTVMFLDLLL
jgi:hypothetical protein